MGVAFFGGAMSVGIMRATEVPPSTPKCWEEFRMWGVQCVLFVLNFYRPRVKPLSFWQGDPEIMTRRGAGWRGGGGGKPPPPPPRILGRMRIFAETRTCHHKIKERLSLLFSGSVLLAPGGVSLAREGCQC